MTAHRTRSRIESSKMPPLHHSIPGQEFNIKDSHVVQWMASNPAILQAWFDHVRTSGDIVYDPASGLWTGKDFIQE